MLWDIYGMAQASWEDSARIQNLQVLRWSWWMLRFFRARECAPLRRERNCFLDPVLLRLFYPFCQQRLEKETHCSPQQMWSTGTALELPLFLLCIVGSHPGTQKWRKKKLRSSKRLKSLSAQDLSNFSSEQKCCDFMRLHFYDLPRYKEKHLVECLTSFSKYAELVVNSVESCYSPAEPQGCSGAGWCAWEELGPRAIGTRK